jgi:signal peptidase II
MSMAQVSSVSASDNPTITVSPLASSLRLKLGIVALLLLVLDQYTKYLALKHLVYQQSVPVFKPWLDWTLVYNHGAAFSFLSLPGGSQHYFFSGIALLAAIGIPIWLRKLTSSEKLLALALSLIWAGAVGNLIDRLRFRYVIDFVHVHWKDVWDYPVFNVADSCITIGAILLLTHELRSYLKARKNAAAL